MQTFARVLIGGVLFASPLAAGLADAAHSVTIDRPQPPPEWALLERELLAANAEACREFFSRYFDEQGFLECVERWGGDDGPDDAIENVAEWPLLHLLGGPDDVRLMVEQAWEGHLRQYTLAKTKDVPFARDGMYYKEFPVMFDWQHNGEGLRTFNLKGLCNPSAPRFEQRLRRFAGFYMNEDPGAPNYDPEHRVIRSMINGSRGPLMRKATGLDWAGDPIEVEHRFELRHGERNYEEMVAHFKDYNDVVGDHPLNLLTTSLALNAYMLTGESKYREWLLEYVDAWYDRMAENGNIIPSNVGLDGTIGGAANGKWYGGTYGWGFTVVVPQDGSLANRNRQHIGFIGFANAYLLTGDNRYLDIWRKQREAINAQQREVDGQTMFPRMYGDQGWYGYVPYPYNENQLEIYLLSMKPEDRRPLEGHGWLAFLDGQNSDYPRQALHRDLASIRERVAAMRADTTTPDTRLADDPMQFNPASVNSLLELMLGGVDPGRWTMPLHCRVRYFDPVKRRAGIPEDVGALVERLEANSVTISLVNTNQVQPRRLIVQAGAYGEHQFQSVTVGERDVAVDAAQFEVRLEPGAGDRITIKMDRYANEPTLKFPWDQ